MTDPTPGPVLPDPPAAAAPFPVYMWLAKPAIGPETPLMVLTSDPEHGMTYRPLLAIDSATAESVRDLAQQAATALGVTAVLREFECVSLLDTVTP